MVSGVMDNPNVSIQHDKLYMLIDWDTDEWRRVYINVERPSAKNAGTMRVQYTFSYKSANQNKFEKSFAPNAPESTALRNNKAKFKISEVMEKKLETDDAFSGSRPAKLSVE